MGKGRSRRAGHDNAECGRHAGVTRVTSCRGGATWSRIGRYTGGYPMDRRRIALFACAWLLTGAAQGEVLQGNLELRWGDAAPAAEARLAPKSEVALALDGGRRIALDPRQARGG